MLNYIEIIGLGWPNCQCHAINDPSVYENLIYDNGTVIPPKAELDAWAANNLSVINSSKNVEGVIPITDKPIPPSTGVRQYTSNSGGKSQLTQISSEGSIATLQTALYTKYTAMWMPGNTLLNSNWGAEFIEVKKESNAGIVLPVLSSTNVITQMKRVVLNTGNSYRGSSGLVSKTPICWRGNNTYLGGFFFFCRFALETYMPSERFFIGVGVNSNYLSTEPTEMPNLIGLGKDSGDTKFKIISTNDSTYTKYDTGITPDASKILDFIMYCKPNDTKVTAQLLDGVTGVKITDNIIITSTLPNNSVFLNAKALIQSTSGNTSKQLAIAKIYVETEL